MKQKIKIMLWDHCYHCFGQTLHINADFQFIYLKDQRGFCRYSMNSENVNYSIVWKLLETSSVSEGIVPEINHMAVCCL